MRMVVAEWQDGAGGSSNDSGGLSDLKVSRTAAARVGQQTEFEKTSNRYETALIFTIHTTTCQRHKKPDVGLKGLLEVDVRRTLLISIFRFKKNVLCF